jgi:hypothetical protein
MISICSRAFSLRDTILLLRGSSSLEGLPPSVTPTPGTPPGDIRLDNVASPGRPCRPTGLVGPAVCTKPEYGFRKPDKPPRCDAAEMGDASQGSIGSVELFIPDEWDTRGIRLAIGKFSLIFSCAASIFSWRRHLARLFWNHTCN